MTKSIRKIGDSANNRIMVRLDTTKLEAIEKQLGKKFAVQVGILGVKAAGRLDIKNEAVGGKSGNKAVPVVQSDSRLSNADIGLIHEKGSKTKNIPRRSFLEVPLTTIMPKMIARVGNYLLQGLTVDNIHQTYERLGAIAEKIVSNAFPSSGYGTWKNLKSGKPSHLIDTAQLRKSIASRVISK